MIKTNLKNYLKFPVFCFAAVILTNSCTNNEEAQTPFAEVRQFEDAFSLYHFKDSFIKENLVVHWEDVNINQDPGNKGIIYEFNTSLRGKNTIENGNQTLNFSYKLLVFQDSNGNPVFELIKFLSNDSGTLNEISYFDPSGFSGTRYHYNLKGETVKIEAWEDGVLLNEFSDEEKGIITEASRAPYSGCENGCYVLVFTEHYTDYYISLNGGGFSYSYSVYEGTTSEWVWVSNGGGGGGGSINDYHYHFDNPHGPAIGANNHPYEILPYHCDCSCEGSETDWDDNLSENMEPKWGQLANKQELIAEIDAIPNLNSMSFEDQINALVDHFNYNLMYDRDDNNNELVQIDNLDPNAPNLYSNEPNDFLPISKDVNRYIYTEIGGWIDFHHVFKIFEWATENGPFAALTQGELGEMWQSLKSSHSAYSYEDLPSNLLGIGMYVRFSESLVNGEITWQQAISIALDEIGWKEPEDAPNFSYIPYLLDEHYPQNYTYTPLLGEALKNYHKQKFCERSLSDQEKIKEAHEKFSR